MNDFNRFDLETAIATWRQFHARRRVFTDEDIDELERHLRDHAARRMADSVVPEVAFREAVASLGDIASGEQEYEKVRWRKLRRQHRVTDELQWRYAMLKSYLKVAFRAILRHKGYSFLNVVGLMLGMACCLLVFQYVATEMSFDQFHSNKERIFRILVDVTQRGEDQGVSPLVGYILGPTMAEEVPGIAQYVRYHPNYGDAVLSYKGHGGERTFTERNALFVDPAFFEIFDYALAHGDRTEVLQQPQTLLMSVSTARKYFGEEDPVGKAVEFTGWVQGTYTVAGLFNDVPATSHLQFEVLLPMADLLSDGRFDQGEAPWAWQNFVTYVELESAIDPDIVARNLTETYRRHNEASFARSQTQVTAHLEPLADIHFSSAKWAFATVVGNRQTVYFLSLIGLLALAMALVNYINLSTARALDRAREVGVRKVLGARRSQLIGQFLLESAFVSMLALGLALGVAMAGLPILNGIPGVSIGNHLWGDRQLLAVLLGVFGFGALLAGGYPAFVLSSFRPVIVLKGQARKLTTRISLRKILVVFQFGVSIVLVAATLIVYAQLQHMQSYDVGLELEQVLIAEEPKMRDEGSDLGAEMTTLKRELETLPAIQEATISRTIPGWGFYYYTRVYRLQADPSTSQRVGVTTIDAAFTSVYGLDVVAGEDFRVGIAMPDSGGVPVLVNETLVQMLGFASNEAAIGEWIRTTGGYFLIRGVLDDFLWSSARWKGEAVMFEYDDGSGHISMKVTSTDLPETIAAIEAAYTTVFPGNPFNFHFADAVFDTAFKADQRFATLVTGFSGIAVLITCLGLFGLVSFTVQNRTKEIGVRKALGASSVGIVALLSKDILKLVATAFVLGMPVAYVVMKRWLDDFAFRIDLSWGLFVITGSIVLGLVIVTVSYQAIRAAWADPVESLRHE